MTIQRKGNQMPEEIKIRYYHIDEESARHANASCSFYELKPGSATAEYRALADKAAEIHNRPHLS